MLNLLGYLVVLTLVFAGCITLLIMVRVATPSMHLACHLLRIVQFASFAAGQSKDLPTQQFGRT
jgi:hypothetical protein